MKLYKKRRLLCQSKHSLLNHGTVNIIVLDDDVLLEDLNGVQLIRSLPLCQHDLAEGALAQDHQVVEVLSSDDILALHVVRHHRVSLDNLGLGLRVTLKKENLNFPQTISC